MGGDAVKAHRAPMLPLARPRVLARGARLELVLALYSVGGLGAELRLHLRLVALSELLQPSPHLELELVA
jgi:hypothetical protein